MHGNVLQPIGNRAPLSQQQQQQHHYGNTYFLDDLYPGKNSAVVQPLQTSHPAHQTQHAITPQKENILKKEQQSCVSPVLPGTGSLTHNITRMLGESTPGGEKQQQASDPIRADYSSYALPGYYSNLDQRTDFGYKATVDDDEVDVEGDPQDPQDHLRTSDLPNTTDSSISTQDSSSPTSSANLESPRSTSPGSGSDVTSPDVTKSQPPKKKARTNYSPEQIQKLLKIFHENPYPDSEMMETIGKDLGVPENKIKIWFQNKRARWRRRVNDNMNNYMQPFMPGSPLMSPVGPYGFTNPAHMTSGHMIPAQMASMTSMSQMMRTSPPHGFPGYFNMPWMQGQVSPNGSQTLSNNSSRYSQTSQHAQMTSQQISPSAFPVSSASSQFSTRTSPQQMTSQHGRQLQYPQSMYPPGFQSMQS